MRVWDLLLIWGTNKGLNSWLISYEKKWRCLILKKVSMLQSSSGDTAFHLLNSRNPFCKGSQAPVTLESLPLWLEQCKYLVNYIFELKDERGTLPWNGRRKTVIWEFAFSLHSVASICEQLLVCKNFAYKFILTYKFSQDHISVLFNKMRRWNGWNNKPNMLSFKYALRRIILRNSIEPSRTGNCTNFKSPFASQVASLISPQNVGRAVQ